MNDARNAFWQCCIVFEYVIQKRIADGVGYWQSRLFSDQKKKIKNERTTSLRLREKVPR